MTATSYHLPNSLSGKARPWLAEETPCTLLTGPTTKTLGRPSSETLSHSKKTPTTLSATTCKFPCLKVSELLRANRIAYSTLSQFATTIRNTTWTQNHALLVTQLTEVSASSRLCARLAVLWEATQEITPLRRTNTPTLAFTARSRPAGFWLWPSSHSASSCS